VDTLLIKDDEQKQIQLSKKDGQWQTPDGFPADQNKVTQLIDKLNGLKTALPVATSESAVKRFKVDEKDFIRHVTLQKGDQTLASLYVGNGAGARQSYVRSAKETAIYGLAIGRYDFPTTADSWQDKAVLQTDKDEITAVNLAELKLERDNQSTSSDSMIVWKTQSLPEGKVINQKAVNDALSPLSSLRFDKVLGKQSYGLEKPGLSFSLTLKKGKRDYMFGKMKDQANYVLKVSDRTEYFQLPEYTVKPLIEKMDRNKWLMDIPKQEEKDEGTEVDTKTEEPE
jgi:hypothetical protein